MATPAEILVVEDDPDVRELLSELLGNEGYATVAAPDVEQALRFLDLNTPDLVITDLMMPGRTGAGLLRHLANDPRHGAVPTILLTAAGAGTAERAIAEAGVITHLVNKPIQVDDLLTVIRKLVGRATAPPVVSASVEPGSGPRRSPG